MLLLILLFISTILTLYFIITSFKNLNYWKKKGVKYVTPLPFFGNMLPTVTQSVSTAELFQGFYNAFPNERYMGLFQFLTPVLFIRDPELIKSITIKNFENFVDHTGFIPEEADPLWGKNLFSSQGQRWRDLRQTLSPAFTSSKMRNMFVLMDECTKQLISYFKEYNQEVVEVELKEIFTRYTNDIIASAAFGIKCDSLKYKENEFLLAGRELSDVSGFKKFQFFFYGFYPKLAKLLGMRFVSNRVGNFFKGIISETISVREQKNIVRPDLINLLMLARKGKLKYEDYLNLPETGFAAAKESEIGKISENTTFLTDEDITAQAVVFFLAGFETTSTLMCFTGHELAINPQIQRKLKEEVIRTSRECEGKITYERLLDMKYLDMVVSESLRKWSQLAWLDRKCTKAFEIEPQRDGEHPLRINVGDICWFPVWAIHRDPQYYPNPDVFDPERFNDENKAKIQPSTYLPFGIGPRNCIGSRFALLETKILFYYILLNFDIVSTEKTELQIKMRRDTVFPLPENGFHVGFKRSQRSD